MDIVAPAVLTNATAVMALFGAVGWEFGRAMLPPSRIREGDAPAEPH